MESRAYYFHLSRFTVSYHFIIIVECSEYKLVIVTPLIQFICVIVINSPSVLETRYPQVALRICICSYLCPTRAIFVDNCSISGGISQWLVEMEKQMILLL